MIIKMYYEKEDCVVEVDPNRYVYGVVNNELIPVTFSPLGLDRAAKLVPWTFAKVKPVDLYFLEDTYSDPADNMKQKRCHVLSGEKFCYLVEIVDECGWHGHIGKNYVKSNLGSIIKSCRTAMNSAYGVIAKLDEWDKIKNYILNDEKVTKELSNGMNNSKFAIKEVKFNGPATIVFWEDGTKTIVKCGPHDKIDYEKGLAMAITKRALGDKGHYYETIKKYAGEEITKTENQVRDDIWMAYQTLVNAAEDKKATKADLLCAMEEAIGHLGSRLDER